MKRLCNHKNEKYWRKNNEKSTHGSIGAGDRMRMLSDGMQGTPAATEGTAESSAPAESAATGSPEPSGEASEEAAGSGGQLLIGHNNILKGNYSVDILENTIQATCDALDIELMVTNDETQVEKSVTNVDNMISAGVDGLIFLGMSDTLFPVIAEKCEAANVPFAIVDHIPADDVGGTASGKPDVCGRRRNRRFCYRQDHRQICGRAGLQKAIVVTAPQYRPDAHQAWGEALRRRLKRQAEKFWMSAGANPRWTKP